MRSSRSIVITMQNETVGKFGRIYRFPKHFGMVIIAIRFIRIQRSRSSTELMDRLTYLNWPPKHPASLGLQRNFDNPSRLFSHNYSPKIFQATKKNVLQVLWLLWLYAPSHPHNTTGGRRRMSHNFTRLSVTKTLGQPPNPVPPNRIHQ